MVRTVLILEDTPTRLKVLTEAVAGLPGDLRLKSWSDAPTMIEEMAEFLPDAVLVSLDWHLNPGTTDTPGTGHDVVRHLSRFPATCPVLIHSTNAVEAQEMEQTLRAAGWEAEHIPLRNAADVWEVWLPKVRLATESNAL